MTSTSVITHQYTYSVTDDYGIREVTVRGFNLANNHTLTANVTVLEWPCVSPNVSINVAVLDNSMSNTAENKDGFAVTAEFNVDCMKNEIFTARWDLLDADQTVIRTLSNATQLISDPFALSAGTYTVTVTASLWSSMFDLSDKTVVVNACINVTVSPLMTGIDGDAFINSTFNSTVELATRHLTYDQSIQSMTDKSGMILEWRCKRSNESWPASLPTESYLPYNGTGGCFGDAGPSILGFAAGLWNVTFDTGYLEPLINYDIQFVVQKDTRTASAEVTVFVQEPAAPVIQITFVTHCFHM